MAQMIAGLTRSYATATDLHDKTYRIVKLSADNTVAISSAATDLLVGVLINAPKSGDNADVVIAGTVKVVAGGVINKGDDLTADSNGAAVATTTTNNVVIGRANVAAAASGDIVEIVVCTPYLHK